MSVSILDENWTPAFGEVFTWFAMDKEGRIAVMVNNCFGNIPACVLRMKNVNIWLENINEYMWEESQKYTDYPEDKNGDFKVDLYSHLRYERKKNKEEVEKNFRKNFESLGRMSEINLIVNRGFFEYFAVEGGYDEDKDYPVGYDGETKNGDYYRFLVPSIYASILDFPKDLRHIIAVSPTIDFTQDRVFDKAVANSDCNTLTL